MKKNNEEVEETMETQPEVFEEETFDVATRPRVVAKNADRSVAQRRIVRFTLDLDREQHNYLKSFAGVNGVKAALVLRALLALMEASPSLAQGVIDSIFDDEEYDNTDEAQ